MYPLTSVHFPHLPEPLASIILFSASPHPHNHLSFVFFDISHSTRCEVISHCGFYLHFPMIGDIKHFFMYLLHASSFEKCLFRSFAHFSILFLLSSYLVIWVPYTFSWILLVRCMVCKYSLTFWKLSPHSVDVSFSLQKFLGWYNPICLCLLLLMVLWEYI